MALQELYSEYKPEGLVGGMVSGLNTGANLGNMFAQTNATNQQTSSREQKLPWELAGLAADADTKVQANDLTRATQPGAIETTNATNKTALMTQQQIQQLLPFDTFNKMITQQTQQSAGILTQAAERLEAGDKSVWQELSAMATTPEAKKVFQETYAKFGKLPPAVAAQEARKWADKLLADLDNLNQETRFKKWQETLKATVDKYQANAAASAGGKTNDKMSIDQRISDAEAKKAALFASGAKPNDPRIVTLTNLVNSLNAARSKTEGMVFPEGGGVPGSYLNYGSGGGASFSDLSGGQQTPAPSKLKLPPGATFK